MIHELKDSFLKDWRRGSYKFLVISMAILGVSWFLFSEVPWLRLLTLLVYTIALATNYRKYIKEEGDSFFKGVYVYVVLSTILFLCIYFFSVIGFIEITAIFSIIGVIALLSISIVQSVRNLTKSKGVGAIILSYAGLVVGLVILFALFFAILSGFPPNGLEGIQKENTPIPIIYFSSVTFFSLGYGDIYPVGNLMMLFSQIEVMLGTIVHVIVIAWIFFKLSKGKEDSKTTPKL